MQGESQPDPLLLAPPGHAMAAARSPLVPRRTAKPGALGAAPPKLVSTGALIALPFFLAAPAGDKSSLDPNHGYDDSRGDYLSVVSGSCSCMHSRGFGLSRWLRHRHSRGDYLSVVRRRCCACLHVCGARFQREAVVVSDLRSDRRHCMACSFPAMPDKRRRQERCLLCPGPALLPTHLVSPPPLWSSGRRPHSVPLRGAGHAGARQLWPGKHPACAQPRLPAAWMPSGPGCCALQLYCNSGVNRLARPLAA